VFIVTDGCWSFDTPAARATQDERWAGNPFVVPFDGLRTGVSNHERRSIEGGFMIFCRRIWTNGARAFLRDAE
jgi:hypothetical protein